MIAGDATHEGTARYRDRFPKLRDARHFRQAETVPGAGEWWMSSIGLGTYLGQTDGDSDRRYRDAIRAALRSGINVLDTAINYRHQRSERNIGESLRELISSGEFQRDEIIVCTKAGYFPFDSVLPADPRSYFKSEYVDSGIVDPKEIAGGMHCMHPNYLRDQIERSRRNLGLSTIDVFYVHNPESQLGEVTGQTFVSRLKQAFKMLEDAAREGVIQYYGIASWNAFRVGRSEQGYMNMETCTAIARELAGERHHFRFVQMPFSLAMPEGWAANSQPVLRRNTCALEAAARLGIAVVGSATLSQGQLVNGLPDALAQKLGMANDAERAIQFGRSAPGLMTSLIGMGSPEHVAENLHVAEHPPMPADAWEALFTRA
jgi:aryl-alcohol dehydrogenase-like predicted oxidoreductase